MRKASLGRLGVAFEDLGQHQLKNIDHAVQIYRVLLDQAATTVKPRQAPTPARVLPDKPSIAVLPFANLSSRSGAGISGRRHRWRTSLPSCRGSRNYLSSLVIQASIQGQGNRRAPGRTRTGRTLCAGRQCTAQRRPHSYLCAADRRRHRRDTGGPSAMSESSKTFSPYRMSLWGDHRRNPCRACQEGRN